MRSLWQVGLVKCLDFHPLGCWHLPQFCYMKNLHLGGGWGNLRGPENALCPNGRQHPGNTQKRGEQEMKGASSLAAGT